MLLVDVIANGIRTLDGRNALTPSELASALTHLDVFRRRRELWGQLPGLVREVNADKTLGAGQLAEAICAHFGFPDFLCPPQMGAALFPGGRHGTNLVCSWCDQTIAELAPGTTLSEAEVMIEDHLQKSRDIDRLDP